MTHLDELESMLDESDGTMPESESIGLTSPSADSNPTDTKEDSHRIIVIGALPRCGATSVAWSAALAGRALLEPGQDVYVLDATCPRRSVLRAMGDHVGASTPVDMGMSLTSTTIGGIGATYLDGPMDSRVDEPEAWPHRNGTEILDVGMSAEEMLRDEHAARWMRGERAYSAHVVLVVPTAVATQLRCEALLHQWGDLAPIDQVVAVGEALNPTVGTTYMRQALEGAIQVPYLAGLQRAEMPTRNDAVSSDLQPWFAAGADVIRDACALPLAATTPVKKRRWR